MAKTLEDLTDKKHLMKKSTICANGYVCPYLSLISQHYFAEVFPHSLCSSDVFVMIKMPVLF